MMTHCLQVAGNLPIKTLVARQLPKSMHTRTCIYDYWFYLNATIERS